MEEQLQPALGLSALVSAVLDLVPELEDPRPPLPIRRGDSSEPRHTGLRSSQVSSRPHRGWKRRTRNIKHCPAAPLSARPSSPVQVSRCYRWLCIFDLVFSKNPFPSDIFTETVVESDLQFNCSGGCQGVAIRSGGGGDRCPEGIKAL